MSYSYSYFDKFCLFIFLFFSTSSPVASSVATDISTLKKSVLQVLKVTEVVSKKKRKAKISGGTGFVINDKGYVITNHHVIAGASAIFIVDGETFTEETKRTAELVWSSANKDLAILKVKDLQPRPALPLADIPIEIGEAVTAIGFGINGMGNEDRKIIPSVTKGAISNIFHGYSNYWDVRVVQHTAPINPGNSGGPLIDSCGRVVGVNTSGPSVLKSLKEQGVIIQGVFFSSHIEEVRNALTRREITFTTHTSRCDVDQDSTSWLWVLITLCSFTIAILALIFSLKKPRQQIIETIGKLTTRYKASSDDSYSIGHYGDHYSHDDRHKSDKKWLLSGNLPNGDIIRFELDEAHLKKGHAMTIGRDKRCDFILPALATKISGRHAKIFYQQGLMLEDLGSSNGTYIDNHQLVRGVALPIRPENQVNLGQSVPFSLTPHF